MKYLTLATSQKKSLLGGDVILGNKLLFNKDLSLYCSVTDKPVAIIDVIILWLMFLTNKIKISKYVAKPFDILELIAFIATFTILLFLFADGAWMLAAAAGVIMLVVLLMQLSSIKNIF